MGLPTLTPGDHSETSVVRFSPQAITYNRCTVFCVPVVAHSARMASAAAAAVTRLNRVFMEPPPASSGALDVGGLRNRGPPLDVPRDGAPELLGAAADRIQAHAGQPLTDIRQPHHPRH